MSPLNVIAIVPVPEKPLCHQKKDLKARWAPEVKQRFSGSLGEEILKKARACFDRSFHRIDRSQHGGSCGLQDAMIELLRSTNSTSVHWYFYCIH
ncbi:hypothetical protein KQX54_006495 [Cotesia glomerata]|uniref:Uncharacterized protein n=1 Tax=Cotesia glomerata TaxID=32391 RepID=A0AAV7ILD8_COTGL|nr:hypothetical protein KQX54_006495 [Cotesia glomerata]